MRTVALISMIILLASCASTNMSNNLRPGHGNIPHQFSDAANTIEEIRKLRPQAKPPIKIAVFADLDIEERKLVETWGEKLRGLGFARSIEVVPWSLLPTCNYRSDSGCYLEEARLAGARLGADALLFMNPHVVADSYSNPASILNLTIAGMWLVPGHHRDTYSVYEASLFDIDNGYLYTIAAGYGKHKTVRPYMYIDFSTGRSEARLAAMEDLGEKLYRMAEEFMVQVSVASQP